MESYLGLRDEPSLKTIGTAGVFTAVPGMPFARSAGAAVKVGVRAAEGAGLGLVQQEVDRRLEGLEAPGWRERAAVGAFGTVLGAGFGGLDVHLSRLADTAAAAAEQIRQRALTREGLASTIARLAEQTEAMGHPPLEARRYAAQAARALYQGRSVPDPPKLPPVHGMEPPPQADAFGPFDAASERAGEALGQQLRQTGGVARGPRLVNPEAGVTLPDRPITIPPSPGERAAGQALARDLDRVAGQSLADDIKAAREGILARDKLKLKQGRQLAADIRTVKQGGTLPAEPAPLTLTPPPDAPAVDVAALNRQTTEALPRMVAGEPRLSLEPPPNSEIAGIRAEAARAAGQRAMQGVQGPEGLPAARQAAQHTFALTTEQLEMRSPPEAAPAVAPPAPETPLPQRRAGEAGYTPEAQRAQMLELARDPEAVAGARVLMRRKGDIDAARKSGTLALEPPPTGEIAGVRTVPRTAAETTPHAVPVEAQVDPDTGQPIPMYRVVGGESHGSTVSEPKLRELGIAVPGAEGGAPPHPLSLGGEAGVLRLTPPPPVDFDVAPGDTPRLRQWVEERRGIFGSRGWFKEASAQLARGHTNAAWKRIMAERVRQLPTAERRKLQQFGRARGEMISTRVGQATRNIVQPPEVRTTQRGQVKMLPSGLLAPIEADLGLPPRTELPTLTSAVVGQIARRADRARVAWIAGNRDAAYRVSRQIVHQMLVDDPSFRAVREVLGMSRDDLARGFASVVTESARTLQKLSAFAREAPPAFVERLEREIGGALPKDLRLIESAGEAQQGVVKLYGGLFGIDPSDAAEWVARAARAQDQLHTEWLLTKEVPKAGPLRSYLSLTAATLTGTVEQFWRNGLMGVLRWNATGVRDLIGAGYAGLYDPAEARILFARAKDRLTGNAELIHAWSRPWGDTMTEKWPALAGALDGLSERDVRHTLKWLSEAPEQAATFLGRGAYDQPVGQVESKVIKALQIWNRAQEYPLRAIAADVRMRTEIRRRGFDPNDVIAQGVPLKTVFGGEDGALRALTLAAKDALELTYAGSAIRGTLNAKIIDVFRNTPILNLFQRFPRFAWSAAPRQFWDLSPASLVEFLTVTQNRGRFTHGRAVRKIMDSLLPAREQRLAEIGAREGEVLRQRMALSADRRVLLRTQQSLEAQQERLAKGLKTRLTAPQIAEKLAATQGRLRSTTNTISALHGSWQAIKAERAAVLAQKQNLVRSFERSSDAMAPESAAEVLANATVGSLLVAGAYALVAQPNQADLPWYQIRQGEPGAPDEPIVDIRAFGGFAQYFYLAKTFHELTANFDRARWVQSGLEGKGMADRVDAAYTGKHSLGSFLAEGAQALLAMNPVAGGAATVLDFLQPQHLDAEGLAQSAKEFFGEMIGALFQPLTSYKNLYSAVDPEEAQIRDFNPTPENPAGGLASAMGKVPELSQRAPVIVSQTSGEPLRSEKPYTRPLTGLTLAAPPNAVERELHAAGVPGAAYSVPRLRDTGLNQELSRVHAQSLREAFDQLVFNNETYRDLATPEERRRYLAQGAGSFPGVLAYAKQLTWARMLEYGPLKVMRLRGMDPHSRLAPDLQLLERWRDAQAARERPAALPPPPAGGPPRGAGALAPPPR